MTMIGDFENQIKSLRMQGLEVEEIAKVMDVDPSVVNLAISKCCPSKKSPISEQDVEDCIKAIKDVALYEVENPRAKIQAAIWIVDEAKGRNEVKRGRMFGDVKNLNIVVINDRLKKVQEARKKVGKILDVETVKE